jgi:hypothetical protein
MRPSRNVVNWLCAILLGGGLATYQMAPQWHAWWGLMDDAEFLGWAPRGRSLAAKDYLPTLAMTEIGQIGTTMRFRPVYYTLRVAERVIWPASPSWYYAARTGMFAIALSLSAWALFTALGGILGGGIFALVSTQWFWRDIWAHGGPAEQYAFVGTSLLAVAGVLAWQDIRKAGGRTAAVLATLGTVLAMGSKENFLILLIPFALVLLRVASVSAHRRMAIALFLAVAAFAAFIVAAVIPGLRSAGSDMYGNPISTHARFAWASAREGRWLVVVTAVLAFLPVAGWRLLPASRRTDDAHARLRASALRYYTHVGLLLVVVISQLVFYSPRWPTFGSRYDFPGMLAIPLALASASVLFLAWLELAGVGARGVRRMTMAIAAVAVALALRHGAVPVRSAAEGNARLTQALKVVLTGAAQGGNRLGASTPVVVEWQDAGDGEPATSVMRLMHEVGSAGPFFLRPVAGAPMVDPLKTYSRDGLSPDDPRARGIKIVPLDSVAGALAASRGAAVIITLRDYGVPTIRLERGK